MNNTRSSRTELDEMLLNPHRSSRSSNMNENDARYVEENEPKLSLLSDLTDMGSPTPLESSSMEEEDTGGGDDDDSENVFLELSWLSFCVCVTCVRGEQKKVVVFFMLSPMGYFRGAEDITLHFLQRWFSLHQIS